MRVSSHAVYKVIAILIIHFEKKLAIECTRKYAMLAYNFTHSYSFICLFVELSNTCRNMVILAIITNDAHWQNFHH